MKRFLSCVMVVILVLGTITPTLRAQDTPAYRIGPEDVLSITFWQKPELNQTVKVRQDGVVALPVIGETRVVGLTTEEVADRIVSRISRYDRDISQALVQVTQYNSRKVFVTGHVGAPGIYTYENVPDLWTVIRDAGGPVETADLSEVTVVSPSGNPVIVNLAGIIAAGTADTLPALLSGTTVDVPAKPLAGGDVYERVGADLDPVVYVTGNVRAPGAVHVDDGMTIYDAIAQAGGFTSTSDMKKVQVISKGDKAPVGFRVDLRPTTKDRLGQTYAVQYEDMIIVGDERTTSQIVRDVAALLAATASVLVIVDYVRGR